MYMHNHRITPEHVVATDCMLHRKYAATKTSLAGVIKFISGQNGRARRKMLLEKHNIATTSIVH